MKPVIIQGSARSDGHTHLVVELMRAEMGADVIDLVQFKIGHFDYDFKNRSDDFIPLMERIVSDYEMLIFATPVYWYSMSAQLKTFIDRISDCMKIRKDLGRALSGKKMAMISCGSDGATIAGFAEPFLLTAEYLDMDYLGDVHTWVEGSKINKSERDRIQLFIKRNLLPSISK